MKSNETIVCLDSRKVDRIVLALTKALPNILNSLVKFPNALGGLLRVNALSAGAGKIRLALEPTKACLNILATLRTLERNLSSIKMTRHGESPSVGIGQNSTAKGNASKEKSVRRRRTANGGGRIQQGHKGSRVMPQPLAVRE